jgi:hypothetical protein
MVLRMISQTAHHNQVLNQTQTLSGTCAGKEIDVD